MKTLLERAKGSALDIRSAGLYHPGILALLSPRAQQFRTLDFVRDYWSNVRRFSEATSGPLPLLHTLKINAIKPHIFAPETMSPPSLPFFSGAVNLKNFFLHSQGVPHLDCFAFPNLTTFELSVTPRNEEFSISQILEFLEVTPTLRVVRIRIGAGVLLEGAPPGSVVVLPNVKIFSTTQGEPGYRIAAHISCPSAWFMSFIYEHAEYRMPQAIFPTSVSWNAIGPQYMSAINGVLLRIKTVGDGVVSCSLFFSSPGPATVEWGYRMIARHRYYETPHSLGEKHSQAFSQAFKSVRTHPLLDNIKHLCIRERHLSLTPYQLGRIAKEFAQLFKFVDSLEELFLDVDDLRPFLSPFFDLPESPVLFRQHVSPSIKGLRIVERSDKPFNGECVAAIVGFVKSQHARGVPFKRAVFHMEFPPLGMAERLKPWVGTCIFL